MQKKLYLFIVGSLRYKNAYKDENKLKLCDDIDCIFIYNDINSLNNFEFLSSKLLNEAKRVRLIVDDLPTTQIELDEVTTQL